MSVRSNDLEYPFRLPIHDSLSCKSTEESVSVVGASTGAPFSTSPGWELVFVAEKLT